ncbi:MAG: peptide chain release factor N(5)-glutamine methyltransferase [Clostridiales bacterium]|nr:peptide chain release factor N(5)-glutamine methyltransferase [Candidatus Blautia equi]
MKSLKTLLNENIKFLEDAGIEEARLDAWLLLEYTTGKNKAWFLAHDTDPAEPELEARYRALIEKRALHIPLQHLTHQAFFMGYEFYVDENVLIPRWDTEILVEEALKALKGKEKPYILDMCTGSGCILLSLLMEREDACGMGADLSEKALAVAERNAGNLGLAERASFWKSDLFGAEVFQKRGGNSAFECDILVSNPPYIRSSEIENLMEEVRLHDPLMALDGREDGLYFYREIAAKAMTYIKTGGMLLCEIGYDQGEAVSSLFADAGFSDVQVVKDLAGLDRVVLGRKDGI